MLCISCACLSLLYQLGSTMSETSANPDKEAKPNNFFRWLYPKGKKDSLYKPNSVQCGKTWLFAVAGNRRPFNFIDTDGVLKGADLDLINDVCAIAGQKCEVTVQPFEECIRTVEGRFFPGRGIMAGWFDVCTAYVSSVDRVNALDFTDKIRTSVSTFTVKKGNPKGFDPTDISEATIGHLNGAYTNPQCLERIGLGKPKKVIVADGIDEAKELLMSGKIDALFSPRRAFNEFDVLPKFYHCDLNGVGMMVKKGSPFPEWWNPAFERYYKSGAYNDMCDNINKKYGGFPVRDCLPRPTAVKDNNLHFLRKAN